MLAESLPPDMKLVAALCETTNSIPERHLAWCKQLNFTGLPVILDELANLLDESGYTRPPPPVAFADATGCTPERLLQRYRVAVARDPALFHSFTVPISTVWLQWEPELLFFSPASGDEPVPPADALICRGGYPELHAGRLAGNSSWLTSMQAFAETNRPVLAECGE